MSKVQRLKTVSPLRADQMLTYSLPHLAVASDLSLRNLYNKIREGKLRVYRVGGRTLVLADDAMRFLRGEPMVDVVETEGQAPKPASIEPIGAAEIQNVGAGEDGPVAAAEATQDRGSQEVGEPPGASTDSAGRIR
jgi:hypothetical protein